MEHWIDRLPEELFEEFITSDFFKNIRKQFKTVEEALTFVKNLFPNEQTDLDETSDSK